MNSGSRTMTESQLSEIIAAIEKIKHCEPLQGKYYDLQRAVLPLLTGFENYSEWCDSASFDMYIIGIARVINKKHPISEYRGEHVKAVADIKALKKKQPPRLSNAKLKELQAQKRIKE